MFLAVILQIIYNPSKREKFSVIFLLQFGEFFETNNGYEVAAQKHSHAHRLIF